MKTNHVVLRVKFLSLLMLNMIFNKKEEAVSVSFLYFLKGGGY